MRLEEWAAISDPATRVIACVGDSTTEIGWAARLREIMYHRWGYGGFGVRHMGKFSANGDGVSEWIPSGTPTKGTNSDAWHIGFHNNGANTNCGTWRLNNSSDIQKWTKPIDCPDITGFKLLVCDGVSSANFSYRIDGGSWTNVSHTWVHDNSLVQLTINTAVTSTVEVRGANAAGTAVLTYMVGIEPLCASTGVKVHEICASGGFSSGIIRTGTSGDWTQWFTQEQPDVVFCNHVNDVVNFFWGAGAPAAYSSRMDAFAQLVTGWGGIFIPYTYFEFGDGVDPTVANQTTKAGLELAIANGYGGHYYNMKSLYGDRTQVVTDGYIKAEDITHPTPKGSRVMANHAWNILGWQPTGKKKVRV